MHYLMMNKCRTWYQSNKHILLLSFFWILGLSFGWIGGANASDLVTVQIRTALSENVSITGAVVPKLAFFIAIFLAMHFLVTWLLFPLFFLKAFSYGYCISCLICTFQSAAWLIVLIRMLADSCFIVLLFIYVLCFTRFPEKKRYFASVFFLVLLIALAIFEHSVISPFTAMLLNY